MKTLAYNTYRQFRKKLITQEQWWIFLSENSENKELIKQVVNESLDAEKRLREYKNSPLFRNKIRKYCNFHGYSDIEPYEVVKVINPKYVEIREMDTELIKAPHGEVGGFSAHYNNYEQEWECISNENNPTRKIKLSSKGWAIGKFIMSDEPVKFYDYNF
jgi:hypothetical protein